MQKPYLFNNFFTLVPSLTLTLSPICFIVRDTMHSFIQFIVHHSANCTIHFFSFTKVYPCLREIKFYTYIHTYIQGRDSPTFKICYISFILVTFQRQTLVHEKTVMVKIGESQPRHPTKVIPINKVNLQAHPMTM